MMRVVGLGPLIAEMQTAGKSDQTLTLSHHWKRRLLTTIEFWKLQIAPGELPEGVPHLLVSLAGDVARGPSIDYG
jgi:hypothetical protein